MINEEVQGIMIIHQYQSQRNQNKEIFKAQSHFNATSN